MWIVSTLGLRILEVQPHWAPCTMTIDAQPNRSACSFDANNFATERRKHPVKHAWRSEEFRFTSVFRWSFGSGEILTRTLPDTGLVITDMSLMLLAVVSERNQMNSMKWFSREMIELPNVNLNHRHYEMQLVECSITNLCAYFGCCYCWYLSCYSQLIIAMWVQWNVFMCYVIKSVQQSCKYWNKRIN